MSGEHSPQQPGQKGTPSNDTMFQGFEWGTPAAHYKRLQRVLPQLREIGITNLYLPPGCSGGGPESVGYDIRDLWNLGEFPQGVGTRWGTLEELKTLANTAKSHNVGLYWDAVLNHRLHGCRKEKFQAIRIDEAEKDQGEPLEIEAWTGFDFAEREGKYSKMTWSWEHFSAVDNPTEDGGQAVYRILGDGKRWPHSVEEGRNYLLGADVDYGHPEVQEDVLAWAKWIVELLDLKGFRFDAVPHFSQRFLKKLITMLEENFGDDLFLVGEVWKSEVSHLNKWLETMDHKFSLFDAPLVTKFADASKCERADLRIIFDDTLVKCQPTRAVTLVQNHDTQKGQSCQCLVEDWFKPLAYSLIMLRAEGYPCLFYGDLYGTLGEHAEPPAANGQLGDIVLARYLYAYGEQDDYWDDPNCIGFVRHGTWDKPDGLACIMSNAEPGTIRMAVGKVHAGKVFTDVLGWNQKSVTIDEEGFGEFECLGVSVSIYVNEEAEGRERFGKFDVDIYKVEDFERKSKCEVS